MIPPNNAARSGRIKDTIIEGFKTKCMGTVGPCDGYGVLSTAVIKFKLEREKDVYSASIYRHVPDSSEFCWMVELHDRA